MPTLHNKITQRAAVRELCETYGATDPYFHDVQGTPDDPKHEAMEIHHTTIKTNVRNEQRDAFVARLVTLSNQSDDVNSFAILQQLNGNIWEMEILVGRPKPQDNKRDGSPAQV